MNLRTLLDRTAKYLGDYNAVRKGRVARRVARRVAGKVMGKWFRRVFG